MLDRPILIASLLWAFLQLPVSIGDLEPIFDQCCTLGIGWGQTNIVCSGFPVPIAGVAAGDQRICQSVVEICCIRTQRTKNCENGKESAKRGRTCAVLPVVGGEAHKDCCEGCKMGLVSAGLQMPCTFSNFAFGTPWDESYYDCCLQTGNNEIIDGDEDECKMFPGRLCAHKCVNTHGGYRCECFPGFKLHANGKACIQDSLGETIGNRCEVNNPCEQECIDTGIAVQCGCYLGYQLLPDQRSCADIDECVLRTDTCNPITQICHNTPGEFQCLEKNNPQNRTQSHEKCPPGYYLRADTQTCNDIDECTTGSVSCDRATEICFNTVGSYVCIHHSSQQCPPGFKKNASSGVGCVDVNECEEGLYFCNNETEICINTHGGFHCDTRSLAECPAGFKWNNVISKCEDIDECAEGIHDCDLNTHNCVNVPLSFHCEPKGSECDHGYQRSLRTNQCEDVNECAVGTHDCNLDTHYCVNTVGGFQCQTKQVPYCRIGYAIDVNTHKCIDIDECSEGVKCLSNQECENTIGSYHCICKEGFNMDPTTKTCIDINECQLRLHNCVESQRCDNTIGSFTCVRTVSCGTGYTLNAETGECEDDNECRIGNHNCGPGFVCRNTEGSFRCDRITCPPRQKLLSDGTCQTITCPRGMEADNNGICIDINECVNAGICRPNQRCINIIGSYRCQNLLTCGAGYELNEYGNQCIDIDECARGTQQCGANQICRNRPGSYLCDCPSGHIMNSKRECEDIDECVRFRGQVCSVNSECQNTVGSYICNCKAGFQQEEDGRNCIDVDECTDTPGLCHQKCINVWGTYQCACEVGYSLQADNRSCKDIDECAIWEGRRRLCTGFCVNEPGSYSCSCPDGYRLSADKRNCQDINECEEQNACRGENEVCLNTRGGFKCNSIICPPNYIRDPDHRNIAKQEDTFLCKKRCRSNDIDCILNNTQTITYQGIAIPSIPVVPSPVILTTMRAISRDSGLSFDTDYVILEGNDQSYFDVLRGDGVGSLRLIEPIIGPLEINLKLSMLIILHHRSGTPSPLSRHLAFIKILVSRYDF